MTFDDEPEDTRSGRARRDTAQAYVEKSEMVATIKGMRADLEQWKQECTAESEVIATRSDRRVRIVRAICLTATALACLLCAGVWLRNAALIAELRLEIQQRSEDRITNSQVMRLLKMHSTEPHADAVSQADLDALELRLRAIIDSGDK